MRIKKLALPLISITIFLILLIRTVSIYGNHSYDLDEYFSINYASDLKERSLNKTILNDDLGNPPLFFIILRYWLVYFNKNELETRFLPIIFFSLTSIVVFKIIKKIIKNDKDALISMMIFFSLNMANPIILYLRPYTLLSFLICLTVYLTINKKNSFLLPIVIVFGFLTHYIYWLFFLFWLISVFISIENNIKEKINNCKFLLIGLIMASPLMFHLIDREILNRSDYHYYFYQLNLPWPNYSAWLYKLIKINFLFDLNNKLGASIWVLAIALMIIFAKKKNISQEKKVFLNFTVMIWTTYLFTALHNYLSYEKYFDFMSFFFASSSTIIIQSFTKNINKAKKNLLIVTIIIWALVPINYRFYSTAMREDWREAAKKLDSYENSIVIDNCYYKPALEYYLKNDKSLYSLEKNDCNLEIFQKESKNSFVYVSRWNEIKINNYKSSFRDTSISGITIEHFEFLKIKIK